MLPNVQTEGVFEALAGRVSQLEGPIPYLRPDVLSEVVRTLMQARRFWSDPGRNQVPGGADFVIVVKSGAVGYDATIGPPNLVALGRAPNLEAIHRSAAMDVYRVLSGHGPAASPTGFDCRRGPIRVSTFRGI
jgi:hypothetical protein